VQEDFVRDMANILPIAKQAAIISALAEGNSIRSIERMTGIHRDTIMRLGVEVGERCAKLMDEKMRGLSSRVIQMDEIWGFVAKKLSLSRFGGHGLGRDSNLRTRP
jgi:hypothetical protein